ncbi:MAG: ARPP-1 family domain-containing protein, partial [Terriglobia bacterium]
STLIGSKPRCSGGSPDPVAAPVTDTDAKKFLGKVGEADLSVFDSPGLGQTVRIADENFSGSCLVNDGEVIHLSLFSNRLRGRRRDNFATLASPGERYGL